jgi:branched-chain amino acid transport system ATP-binding protein
MSPALQVTGLRKSFGELHVLEGIDLTVAERGVHSVIGPNGAGKTTLFNCISGVLAPDSGRVSLGARDITSASVVQRVRLGLVRTFQVSRVFDSMSAADNVRLALYKRHLQGRLGGRIPNAPRRRLELRLDELLHEVGLATADRDAPASRLPDADRRAVEVAMALACDPVVLCLDEPTAGIGVGEAERLAGLIGRLGERLAVLLIEHRMSLVQSVSSHVSVLVAGTLLAQGPPHVVAADPRVQAAYLGRADATAPVPVSARRPAQPVAAVPGRAPDDANGLHGRRHDLTLLEVDSCYGSSQVLHGVSLIARQGEVSSVLGRNGAGKTTTLATVMGLVRARSGSIRYGDRELRGLATHTIASLGISLVPEHRWVFPDLTVDENLRLAAGRRAPFEEAYAEFPVLAERRHARGADLSGGQQQMLAFARTLVRSPTVVLLDEPTQGLSPQYVEVVINYVRRLRDRGVTVVLVEQNLDLVAAVSDTVYLMSDGQISAQLGGAAIEDSAELVRRHLLLDPESGSEPVTGLDERHQRGARVAWATPRSRT